MEKTIGSLAVEARRKYYREWRKKNPDKVKAANARYWEKKAVEQLSEQTDGNEEGR